MSSAVEKVVTDSVFWRPMADADLPEVAAIERRIHASPWTLGNFRDACAAGNLTCVGERSGVIVAYGVLLLAPGEAELLNISVRPEAARMGIGRALLRRLLSEAARRGAQRMLLEVRVSNPVALHLYATAGFVAIARREGYYPARDPGGAREAAVVMQRMLALDATPDDTPERIDAGA